MTVKPSNQTIPPSVSFLGRLIGRAIGKSVETVASAMLDLFEASPLLARRVDELRAERRTAREQVRVCRAAEFIRPGSAVVMRPDGSVQAARRTTLEKFAKPGDVVELVDPRKVN